MSKHDANMKKVSARMARLSEWLDAISAQIGAPSDPTAYLYTCASGLAAAFVFLAVSFDEKRLRAFLPEHVTYYSMADSYPQRLAFQVYAILLIAGAVVFGITNRSGIVAERVAVFCQKAFLIGGGIAIFAAVSNANPLPLNQPLKLATWGVAAAFAAIAVVASIARMSVRKIGFVMAVILILSSAPLIPDLAVRVESIFLPSVDLHSTSFFAGADMLAHGYRLFSDVQIYYGVLLKGFLGAAIRSGVQVDFGDLIHLTQIAQAATFFLFLCAAWLRPSENDRLTRVLGVLFVGLLALPILSPTNIFPVQFPTQSGLRFFMFPVGAIVAILTARIPLRAMSAIIGLCGAIALLNNIETGLAISAGLGLGWLVKARESSFSSAALSATLGLTVALLAIGAFLLFYYLAFGSAPTWMSRRKLDLISLFGSGYGGMSLNWRDITIPAAIFLHCGYFFMRAIACVLGRRDNPDPASVAIATMVLVWAPYWVNRPAFLNLWSYILLYGILIIPWLSEVGRARPRFIAATLLVLFPATVYFAAFCAFNLSRLMAMSVQPQCFSGLSLEPEMCEMQKTRAIELRRVAMSGDVGWLTVFPLLTLKASQAKPPLADPEYFHLATTDLKIDALADEVRSARTIALLLDGPAIAKGNTFTAPILSIYAKIARAAGYSPCEPLETGMWQVWLQQGACREGNPDFQEITRRFHLK